MRLERSEVAGFFHFTEPFRLDLREVPDGLIAVVGDNGAGKTGLALDAPLASLYGPGLSTKAFPSREGSLASYATSRQAYIETVWDLDGCGQVRCRVNVDGKSRRTDAVLEEIGADGTRRAVNNGLVPTYRDAVAERFPSLRSLLASAYASQNRRGGFGELGQKERMELFVELADLAHLDARSQTAKRCQSIADGIAARVRTALEVVTRETASLDEIHVRLRELTSDIESARSGRQDCADHIDVLERHRALVAVRAEEYAAAVARSEEVRLRVNSVVAECELHQRATQRIQSEHDQAATQIERRYVATYAGIDQRRQAAMMAHERAAKDREERIAGNRTLLAQAEAIRTAMMRAAEIDTQRADATNGIEQARRDLDDARQQVRAREMALREALAADVELTAVRRRADLLGTVKFGDSCGIEPACPLVIDAVMARSEIPRLEDRAAQVHCLRDEIVTWTAQAKRHETQILELTATLNALVSEAKRLQAQVALAPHLEHAEAKIAEYERDGQQATAAHEQACLDWHAECEQVDGTRACELETLETLTVTRTREAETKLRELEAVVASTQKALEAAQTIVARTSGAKADLDRADGDLRTARAGLLAAETSLARLTAEHDVLAQRRDELSERQTQAQDWQRRVRRVEEEGLAWATLSRALGRDGLQRLEIDAAGPVVSDLANQLLEVGYGTRFQVQVVTEVATASGKDTKEKFTILALDQEYGGESRDVGDLSGGERVIVEEAIRAALAVYVNLRSRMRFKILWRDECSGALSPDNVPRYAALLRKMLTLSGADQCLFVCHQPELAEMADAIVTVSNGRVESIRLAA